jgi:hypothetical protein
MYRSMVIYVLLTSSPFSGFSPQDWFSPLPVMWSSQLLCVTIYKVCAKIVLNQQTCTSRSCTYLVIANHCFIARKLSIRSCSTHWKMGYSPGQYVSKLIISIGYHQLVYSLVTVISTVCVSILSSFFLYLAADTTNQTSTVAYNAS